MGRRGKRVFQAGGAVWEKVQRQEQERPGDPPDWIGRYMLEQRTEGIVCRRLNANWCVCICQESHCNSQAGKYRMKVAF